MNDDITKTIAKLKKVHEHYLAEVAALTAKRDAINAELAEAHEHALQTGDALCALTGKPTLTKLITDALAAPPSNLGIPKIPDSPDTRHAGAEIPLSGNLPPAEAGMKWVKNEVGEDVLVPINPPAACTVPGVVQSLALPTIDEDGGFEDPTSFLT
jgi:hypothetical protein